MHTAQAEVIARWADDARAPFGHGIGLSTGPAAALLGSEGLLEYTLGGRVQAPGRLRRR